MINFSAIPAKSLPGRLLRRTLRWIPPEASVPILQGPLRGKKWIVGSGDHGYWIGSYEWNKQRVFREKIRPGSVVFDVGAHVGFYTLLASVLVGADGRVVTFEPVDSNLRYLEMHLRLNNISNVTVMAAAVADRPGTAPFAREPSTAMGHFSPEGSLHVPTVALDDLVASGKIPPPNHIKIDVEGAEKLVLIGARRLLQDSHPTLYLATDVGDLHRQCCRFLAGLGYELQPINGSNLDQSYEILACK